MTPNELNQWLQNDDISLIVQTDTQRHLTVFHNILHDLIDDDFKIELDKFTITELSPTSVLLKSIEDDTQFEIQRI